MSGGSGWQSWLGKSVRRELLDLDLDKTRPHMTGKVLEIGAGRNGRRGDFQAPAEQNQWTFLDISALPRPDVISDMAQLPFANRIFDLVLCLEVLEYVENPLSAVAEIKRVLPVGGKVIFSAPFFHREDKQNDKWRFTEQGIRSLMLQAGLYILEIHSQGGAYATMVNTVKYALRIQPEQKKRWLVPLARPFLEALLRRDYTSISRSPALATFSTGHLVLAQRNDA